MPRDALQDLIQREIARDPAFADEWADFTAALDLRLKRKAAGLTQEDVAQRIGVDQSAVARLERNPGGVSMKRFRAYLRALGCEVQIVPASGSTP